MGDWFDGAGNGAAIDAIEMMDGTVAGKALAELVAAGALVSVGLTSDSGAMGVTVTVDGRWRREYFRDAEALIAWLSEALSAVQDARASRPASGGSGNGSRRRRGL